MATISGIPPGMYNVSVFVLENNGLPFNRSATTPRNVSVTDGGHGKLSVGNSHNYYTMLVVGWHSFKQVVFLEKLRKLGFVGGGVKKFWLHGTCIYQV